LRKASALRVGRPLESFIGPLTPPILAQKDLRLAALLGDLAACFAETGGTLRAPVTAKAAAKSPKKAARRKSFCARMGGVKGPMKDSKGRPTRKALALRKWDC